MFVEFCEDPGRSASNPLRSSKKYRPKLLVGDSTRSIEVEACLNDMAMAMPCLMALFDPKGAIGYQTP